MKRLVFAAAAAAAISGCSSEKKEAAICLAIVREVVVDPGSVVVNSQSITTQEINNLSELRAILNRMDGVVMSPARIELASEHYKAGRKASRRFVSLDATFDGSFGKQRQEAICQYIEHADTTELVSFSLGNQDVNRSEFVGFFLDKQRPKNLDALYRIQ